MTAGRQGAENRHTPPRTKMDRRAPTAAGETVDDNGSEGGKRRRGRPVGSKDRQPRVKRMATSPHPSESGDKTTPSESEGRRKPWKIILTAEQAVEIYRKRTIGPNSHATSSCRSNEVAEQYGVNSKTIRDIWNRATWVKATRTAWTAEEEADYVQSQSQSATSRTSGGNSTSPDLDATRSSESEVCACAHIDLRPCSSCSSQH